MSGPTILLSAGEPSGDAHGAALARELRRRWPDARLFGLGGPRMAAQGVDLLAGLDRLAVMGFVEVLAHLPFFVRLLGRVRREIATRRPDLVIPIDYPGFNIRLSEEARRRRIPLLYYIAPQVWAWRTGRIRRLAELADRLAVILPFEEPIFREAGARVRFVGHPLLDERPEAPDRNAVCAAIGLDPERPVLALLPGSRRQELGRHLAAFLGAAEMLRGSCGRLQPVVVAGGDLSTEAYAGVDVPIATDVWGALHVARGAIVKSGTGTLQAALTGTPMVVAYRTHTLTYALARRLVHVEQVALVNLVAGRPIVPERLQSEATPTALAEALLPRIREGREREEALAALAEVGRALEPPAGAAGGAATRVAAMAAELLDGAAA